MLSKEKREQIQDMLAEGVPVRTISKETGMSRYSIGIINDEMEGLVKRDRYRNYKRQNEEVETHYTPQYHTIPEKLTYENGLDLFHIAEDIVSLYESDVITHPLFWSLANDAQLLVENIQRQKNDR